MKYIIKRKIPYAYKAVKLLLKVKEKNYNKYHKQDRKGFHIEGQYINQ